MGGFAWGLTEISRQALVQAAAKFLASGLVMDYGKLNAEFEEAAKTTCENIMDVLNDIVSFGCSGGAVEKLTRER